MRLLWIVLVAGCLNGAIGGGGGYGASPGGAQDIAYARDVIAGGGVPYADQIPVEGLLSEHDLPTAGPPCDELLCVRPTASTGPSLTTGDDARWVLVGLTSGLPAAYVRPPLDLVVLMDSSSSMAVDMEETAEAVVNVIEQLNPGDRLAVAHFDGSVHRLHGLDEVTDPAALARAVRDVRASGSWDVDGALAWGFDQLDGAAPDRLRRVLMLSCSYPSFLPDASDVAGTRVRDAAARGVGFTLYGVLLGWSPTVSDVLGQTRGGAYGYLADLDDVERAFSADFDDLVTPLAYDLRAVIDPGPGYEIDRVYGIPGDAEHTATTLDVTTAFLSKQRGGGVMARLKPAAEAADPGSVSLTYDPEPALGGHATDQQVAVLDVDPGSLDALGVDRGVALVNQAEQMRAACDAFHDGDRDGAASILDDLVAYLEPLAGHDADLDRELALVRQLRTNVSR